MQAERKHQRVTSSSSRRSVATCSRWCSAACITRSEIFVADPFKDVMCPMPGTVFPITMSQPSEPTTSKSAATVRLQSDSSDDDDLEADATAARRGCGVGRGRRRGQERSRSAAAVQLESHSSVSEEQKAYEGAASGGQGRGLDNKQRQGRGRNRGRGRGQCQETSSGQQDEQFGLRTESYHDDEAGPSSKRVRRRNPKYDQ